MAAELDKLNTPLSDKAANEANRGAHALGCGIHGEQQLRRAAGSLGHHAAHPVAERLPVTSWAFCLASVRAVCHRARLARTCRSLRLWAMKSSSPGATGSHRQRPSSAG